MSAAVVSLRPLPSREKILDPDMLCAEPLVQEEDRDVQEPSGRCDGVVDLQGDCAS